RATDSAFSSQGFFNGFSACGVIKQLPAMRRLNLRLAIYNWYFAILSFMNCKKQKANCKSQIERYRFLQDHGAVTISPSARVPRARKVIRSIDCSMKRTEPSAMANWTPPG